MKSLIVILLLTSFTISMAQKKSAVVKGRHADREAEELPKDLAPIPFTESGDVEYQEVIEVPGLSKDALYLKAREWFAVTFKSSEAVLEIDDKEAGKLLGKPYNEITYVSNKFAINTHLFYTVTIEVKDDKYRYTINNLYYKSIPFIDQHGTSFPATITYPKERISDDAVQAGMKYPRYKDAAITCRQDTYDAMQKLIESLKAAMQKSNTDDW